MPPARRTNVLVVDDNRANQVTLEAVLGDDHQLIFASCGREAIELVTTRNDIDVVVLDVQMPDMDGFETARQLKSLPNGEELPIIFVTAVYSEDPFVRRGYEVGALDYFNKPFDPRVLRSKVRIYASFRMHQQVELERERRLRDLDKMLEASREWASALERDDWIALLLIDEHGQVRSSTQGGFDTPIELFHRGATSHPALNAAVDKALRKTEPTHGIPIELSADGTRRHMLVSVLPLRSLDDTGAQAVVVLKDGAVVDSAREDFESRTKHLFGATGA
jgi:CheY-like chemotaxis protein